MGDAPRPAYTWGRPLLTSTTARAHRSAAPNLTCQDLAAYAAEPPTARVWGAPTQPRFATPAPAGAQGYRFYLIVFYVLVTTLFAATGICVWVGWCFKNDSFPFLWPIKVARVVVSVFVSIFYIASLNIFLIAVQCQPEKDASGKTHWVHLIYHTGGHARRGFLPLRGSRRRRAGGRWRRGLQCMKAMGRSCTRNGVGSMHSPLWLLITDLCPPPSPPPRPDCLTMPHVVHAAFSLTSSVLFFSVALLLVVADHELQPMSRSLLAAPHSMAELRMLLCKTVITVADIVLRPAPLIQVAVYASSCVLMLWYQLRWVSHPGAGAWPLAQAAGGAAASLLRPRTAPSQGRAASNRMHGLQ
jgi:hypothetical protein